MKGNSLYAVTAFHAYAHTVNCQVLYNPRYVNGLGLTGTRINFRMKIFCLNISKYVDGEGCERFWSYLNRFVSITRGMKATNRRYTILDAVQYNTYKKMTAIRKFL